MFAPCWSSRTFASNTTSNKHSVTRVRLACLGAQSPFLLMAMTTQATRLLQNSPSFVSPARFFDILPLMSLMSSLSSLQPLSSSLFHSRFFAPYFKFLEKCPWKSHWCLAGKLFGERSRNIFLKREKSFSTKFETGGFSFNYSGFSGSWK